MHVIKRDGSKEPVRFEKVSNRIRKMTYGLNQDLVDPVGISQKVIAGIYDGISTQELDTLAAETAASMIPKHPDHSILASRIAILEARMEWSGCFGIIEAAVSAAKVSSSCVDIPS